MTDAIRSLEDVSNTTEKTKQISDETLAMTMPVDLATIQELTNKILNTAVDESKVGAAYDKATQGLADANEVLETSQRAV